MHAAHGVLQAKLVAGGFADFDVGEQAEHRAAPIFAAPGVGIVEAAVAGLRQALRHVAHHRLPDFRRREIAGLHPRDRFDIDGKPLRQPGVALRQVGQGEVHHLVHHHPVAPQDLPRWLRGRAGTRIAAPR